MAPSTRGAKPGRKRNPQNGTPSLCGQQPRFGLGQFQSKASQLFDDFASQIPQARLVIAEQQEIIRVAQIGAAALLFGNPMIHRIEVKVAPQLACEIADGNTSGTVCRRHEVVSGEKSRRNLWTVGKLEMILVCERHHAGACQAARQLAQQNFVVDVRKELANVALQHIAMPVNEPAAAFPPCGRSLVPLAGKASREEAAFEHRLHQVAKRMMDDPVAKRRSRNGPALRLTDFEETIARWHIRSRKQFLPQVEQVALQSKKEVLHIGASALSSPGLSRRLFEIGKRRDSLPMCRAIPFFRLMGHDKPPVFTLLAELAAWSMDRTAAFPKSHRFTFGERIDNLTLDCIELCLEAIYLPPSAKKSPLLRLNIQLEKLRVFWRMVSEKKWISLNQLAFVISKIDEIGRMTGGWIKTLSSK